METQDGRYSIHSPLGGLDLSLSSAQALALAMDSLGETQSARLLNFAHIAIDKTKLLGQGSFSRVYRYCTVPCSGGWRTSCVRFNKSMEVLIWCGVV